MEDIDKLLANNLKNFYWEKLYQYVMLRIH